MVAFRPMAALAAGAIAAQLPLFGLVLQGQVPALQASWGWSAKPKCNFANGVCMEGPTVEAGKSCMPTCSNGTKDPSNKTALVCPASKAPVGTVTPDDGTVEPDNGWWDICGPGNGTCKANLALGANVTCPAVAKLSAAASSAVSAQGSTAAAVGIAGLALAAGGVRDRSQLRGLVLQGQVPALQAAWGWSTKPKCIFKNGVCVEGATVEAGNTCTPQCSDKTQNVSDKTALACPVSDGKATPDNGWWDICGPGAGACASNNALGATVTCPVAAKAVPASSAVFATGSTAAAVGIAGLA
eukprot:CAMPEP_0183485216 /NCGR_PEP_ID=MMETSP0370-20130417/179314_1 /TAXON_ID=268820 /ORGANISM="Peridinium aciculiferum, Strain PAER-2" /LENGTH=298 /DNA_ID=CAMNT_0025678513 /DNA_START=75 /DNA_END=966 /DNA_ORIENTATION=+